MSTLRINKRFQSQIYFVTITVNSWLDIFTSSKYCDLLIRNLVFYTNKHSGALYGYVLMTNHIHLLLQSDNIIKFIQSFKSYTTKEVKQLLLEDNRKYLLEFIERTHQGKIWRGNNWPVSIYSRSFFYQKLNYIHNNPVKKGIVELPEYYAYSSARNYLCHDDSVIQVRRL